MPPLGSAPDLARLRSVLNCCPTDSLPPRLLDVGCGTYPSARTLHDARPTWTLWGLDRDAAALRFARASDSSLRLISADARSLPDLLRPLLGGFGLVIVRHPDLFRSPAWATILPRLPALVAPGGSLVITLYAPEEVEIVRRLALPGGVLLNDATLVRPDLAGHDRYVRVYRRDP